MIQKLLPVIIVEMPIRPAMNNKTDPASAIASLFAARAVNLVNAGLIVLDASQDIVLWNGWMVPRSGYAAARVRGSCLFDVFPELRGSRVESAVLAALTEEIATTIPAASARAPFPLREAGSFDGARIEQAVSVTPFSEGGERFCLVEIRDVSGACSTTRNRCAPVPTSTAWPASPTAAISTSPSIASCAAPSATAARCRCC